MPDRSSVHCVDAHTRIRLNTNRLKPIKDLDVILSCEYDSSGSVSSGSVPIGTWKRPADADKLYSVDGTPVVAVKRLTFHGYKEPMLEISAKGPGGEIATKIRVSRMQSIRLTRKDANDRNTYYVPAAVLDSNDTVTPSDKSLRYDISEINGCDSEMICSLVVMSEAAAQDFYDRYRDEGDRTMNPCTLSEPNTVASNLGQVRRFLERLSTAPDGPASVGNYYGLDVAQLTVYGDDFPIGTLPIDYSIESFVKGAFSEKDLNKEINIP